MSSPNPMLPVARAHLVAHYWSGERIRSRSVSDTVFSGKVDVPEPPPQLRADWDREISLHLDLAPGDVEALPLARTRARWPDLKQCLTAASDWTRSLGLQEVLATSDMALMASLGTKYHHDAEHYGGMAFCNLFLSGDCGLDVHFPATGHRIPLVRGTVVVFDTGQPHALIERLSNVLSSESSRVNQDHTQIFLTWELPVENPDVARALQIAFDTDPISSQGLDEEQVWVNGARASVCPNTGGWCPAV